MKKIRLVVLLLLLMASGAVWWYDHGTLTLQGELNRFVRQQALVSGSIAIVRQGQITTTFEVGAPRAASPDAQRPIASLSKLLTAQTVALLVREGKLHLGDRLSDRLPELPFANDPGYMEITVQHLLQHTAGFDRGKSGDPLFENEFAPSGCTAAVQTAVARPLDHLPGQVTKYSNVGYCILGMLIERVTAQSYEAAVLHRLMPLGERDRLSLGPPESAAFPDNSVFSPAEWRGLGAAGGWFTNAELLVQLLEPVKSRDLVLKPLTAELHHAFYYGQSWRVWSAPHSRLTHYGAAPQAYAFAMQSPDAGVIVALFDGRPIDDENAAAKLIGIFESQIP